MTTIKAYTDINQSKVLAEILPLESADMFWQSNLNSSDRQYLLDMGKEEHFDIEMNFEHCKIGDYDIPAWSLAALLNALPSGKALIHDKESSEYKCICNNVDTAFYNNSVDACYDLILKLDELNLL